MSIYCSVQEEPPQKMAKFSPFSGSSRRLNGKASSQSVPLASQSVPLASSTPSTQHREEGEKGTTVSESPALRKHSGKLVFGSNTNNRQRPNQTENVCLATLLSSGLFELYNHSNNYLCSLGCHKEQQSRGFSENRRAQIPSVYGEEVFT